MNLSQFKPFKENSF